MDTKTRIFELLDERGVEQKVLAETLGVSPDVVSSWRRGKLSSYRKYLPQIAEVLGTTVSYLLTGENSPSPEGDELRRRIDALTPEERARVLDFLAFVESRRGKQ